jgi:hypothetical protein
VAGQRDKRIKAGLPTHFLCKNTQIFSAHEYMVTNSIENWGVLFHNFFQSLQKFYDFKYIPKQCYLKVVVSDY